MSALADLLGDKLAAPGGKEIRTADVSADVVGLYCSAHWCPPCRGFTPKLVEIYEACKKAGKSFEVVFVSSDRDEDQFKEYFAEMPWLALPFEDRQRKAKLSSKYKVSGIPTLVLVDGKTGETITTKGRDAVASDPEGFPWRPAPLHELLAGPILAKGGGETSVKQLCADGVEHIFLYFSAHWCPPCKRFTPVLSATADKLKKAGAKMEGVFVSSDRDQGSFDGYWGEMAFAAVPFGDSRKEKLSEFFEVEGIPTLVTLKLEGDGTVSVVNADARGPASSDPEGANFPWPPPLVCEFDEDPSALNSSACLVVLEEKAEKVWDEVGEALTSVAKARKAAKADPEVVFGTIQEMGGGIGSQIRKLCGLGMPEAGKAQVVLLDLSDEGAYYLAPDGPVTEESLKALIAGYKAGSLERRTVSK